MSSSEKRTIKINPELFRVSDKNSSRKKRTPSEKSIKVKSQNPVRNKTLRNGVLRMLRDNIREKQKEEYNTLINPNPVKSKETPSSEFKTDFEKSLQYFSSLNENEVSVKKPSHNTTFKREPVNYSSNSNIGGSNILPEFNENSISSVLPDVFNDLPIPARNSPIHLKQPLINLPPPPQYGCLKGGSLPTYRSWVNGTQKNYFGNNEIQNNIPPNPAIYSNSIGNTTYSAPSFISKPIDIEKKDEIQNNQNIESTILQKSDSILSIAKKDLAEKKQKLQKKINKENIQENKPKLKYLKQKKIYNRTYRVGKSKVYPKVGVLISNKTVRQRISTNALHLKQTPMPEVKKFLVKKGFIKVGSIAPNDVLRQMYECAHLMCGEIENHNPENLLYNYFNDINSP